MRGIRKQSDCTPPPTPHAREPRMWQGRPALAARPGRSPALPTRQRRTPTKQPQTLAKSHQSTASHRLHRVRRRQHSRIRFDRIYIWCVLMHWLVLPPSSEPAETQPGDGAPLKPSKFGLGAEFSSDGDKGGNVNRSLFSFHHALHSSGLAFFGKAPSVSSETAATNSECSSTIPTRQGNTGSPRFTICL